MIPWRREERGETAEALWQQRLTQGRCPRCGRDTYVGIDWEWHSALQEEYPRGIWCQPPDGCGYWQGYGDVGIKGDYFSNKWIEGPIPEEET